MKANLHSNDFIAGFTNSIPNVGPVMITDTNVNNPHTTKANMNMPTMSDKHRDLSATFIIKPLEATFNQTKNKLYCKFKLGVHKVKTTLSDNVGQHITWSDSVSMEMKHSEHILKLKVKDKDRTLRNQVGGTKIDLNSVAEQGRIIQWFDLTKKNQVTGKILLEVIYSPRAII